MLENLLARRDNARVRLLTRVAHYAAVNDSDRPLERCDQETPDPLERRQWRSQNKVPIEVLGAQPLLHSPPSSCSGPMS